MRVLVSGINGFMGQELVKRIEAHPDTELVGGVDMNAAQNNGVPVAESFTAALSTFDSASIDIIIDFSHRSTTLALLDYAVAIKKPLVLCTTGQTAEEKQAIIDASKQIPIFFSANMSLGVAVLVSLAKKTAQMFPDAEIEIVETHHDRKLDAPSGTAIMIADAICSVRENATKVCGRSGQGKRTKQEIGIHALRLGNIVGIHEVIVNTGTQAITLKHEAYTRALFADGAMDAAFFLFGKGAGAYNMDDLVK